MLQKAGKIQPPEFVASNVQYETISGSVAYGISTDFSDEDITGFCIPRKEHLFPSMYGEVEGFGPRLGRFDQFIAHGIEHNKKYDLTIFNIAKFFNLAANGNINVLEALYTPRDCIVFSTPIAEKVRQNRHLFLSKKIYNSVIGYAYSQLHKSKSTNRSGKRAELHEKYGMDVKFLTHTLRLLDFGEQILETGDLDMRKDKERLKACRRGEIPLEDVNKIFNDKEKYLHKLYQESKLPHSPDWDSLKSLLMDCVEHHYGQFIEREDHYKKIVDEIRRIVC